MSTKQGNRYWRKQYERYNAEDEMTEEELGIAGLKANLDRAKVAYDTAFESANLRRLEYNGAANRLAEAQAKLLGIETGTLIEFEDGGQTKRAVVSHVQQPKWSLHGEFTLYAKLILRDGSTGKREVELGQDDFDTKTVFGKKARVVVDSTGK